MSTAGCARSSPGDTCGWQPPTPYPDDGKFYAWNESGLAWEEVGDYPPIAEVDDLNS